MKHTLEGHKIFPYIAWTTVIGFAAFVLHFTLSLGNQIGQLEASTAETVAALEDIE